MKHIIRNTIIAVLLLSCSGCFPYFGREGRRGDHRHGGQEHHDQGGHGSHRD